MAEFENVTWSSNPMDLSEEEATVLLDLELGVLARGIVASKEETR